MIHLLHVSIKLGWSTDQTRHLPTCGVLKEMLSSPLYTYLLCGVSVIHIMGYGMPVCREYILSGWLRIHVFREFMILMITGQLVHMPAYNTFRDILILLSQKKKAFPFDNKPSFDNKQNKYINLRRNGFIDKNDCFGPRLHKQHPVLLVTFLNRVKYNLTNDRL